MIKKWRTCENSNEKLSFNQVAVIKYLNPTFTTEVVDWISVWGVMDT